MNPSPQLPAALARRRSPVNLVSRLLLAVLASLAGSKAAGAASCASVPGARGDAQYESAGADGQEVLDLRTGLVWARCSVGQQWKNGSCEGRPSVLSWQAAVETARSTRGVQGAWRLPTHRELTSLADRSCPRPAINGTWFPGTAMANYWTATPSPEDPEAKAWTVDFFDGGYKAPASKTQPQHVRLVRDGVQVPAPDRLAQAAGFVPVIVYSSAGRFDGSFSEAAWQGAQRFRMDRKLPFREVQLDDAQPADRILERIAASGVDMIIAVGFAYQEAVEKVAARHPSTRFVLIDAPARGANVQSIVFGQHEGSFLVGMMAAMASKSGRVGFIGGMDVPVVRSFACGFAQGARHARRDVKLLSDMVASDPTGFNDPGRAAELASSQASQGADVIFAAAGRSGQGVLRIARHDGPWVIGVDVNQNAAASGAVLTSMVKRVDTAVFEALEAGRSGRWQPGVRRMGLKEGGVDWALDAHNRKLVTPEQATRVEQARRDIVEGRISVTDQAVGARCPVP
jgi:basic membrane protein A